MANADDSFTTPGITTYTIGTGGTYEITADGAQGGGSNISGSVSAGGLGAAVAGEVFLQAGAKLEVVVGGEGQSFGDGGGGGGSFVIETYDGTKTVDTILAVAGGGGGASYSHNGGAGGVTPTGGHGGGFNGDFGGGDGGQGGAAGYGGSGNGDNAGGGGGGFTGGEGGTGGDGGAGVGFNGATAGGTFRGGSSGFIFGGAGGVGGGGGGGGGANSGGGGGGGGSYLDTPFVTEIFETAGINSGNGEVTIAAVCYMAGTRILTHRGELAVEKLRVDDLLVTASGAHRPVRWLGSRRVDCARHPEPTAVWPIRIEAGAFAPSVPRRDLWVSPGHSILVDGVLIQAEKLVNDASIVQVPLESVEYWHVELDSHDVILAEGLTAESYLDTGNRAGFFNNGGTFLEAHPDFRPKHFTDTCAPLVFEGEILRGVKSRLRERAQELGFCLTDDSELHIVAEGERIEPLFSTQQRIAFVIPPDRKQIELRCRGFVPAHVDAASDDQHRLGVCVGRLQIDGVEVPLDDVGAFYRGWHDFEVSLPQHRKRWSKESTPLPDATRLVVIELAERSSCWAQFHAKLSATAPFRQKN